MKPVIEIKQLGKRYRIQSGEMYQTFRDMLTKIPSGIFTSARKKKEDFWALRDIDLEIFQGERIGIIGRNGAGKTTLLKILSRVTAPTTGYAITRGRLSSLLEVGTGFHPELTGRENIYFNGSVLGLKRAEIRRQFNAIVEFSGVDKFLDTPLKHYSSGMQLRLAFAVAAHLDPEILLIDEVLAVGDMAFQQKCIGKMEEVSQKQGKTILFVSHNLGYIASLCDKAILLDNGQISAIGKSEKMVSLYMQQITNRPGQVTWNETSRPGNNTVRLHSLRMVDSSFNSTEEFKITERIGIEMVYEVLEEGHILWLGHNIHNEQGLNIFDTHSTNTSLYKEPHTKGTYSAVVWIPEQLLNTGSYFVSTAIFNQMENTVHLHQQHTLMFTVHESFEAQTARGMTGGEFPGVIRPFLQWTIKKQ